VLGGPAVSTTAAFIVSGSVDIVVIANSNRVSPTGQIYSLDALLP
jgi:hypothetical protein